MDDEDHALPPGETGEIVVCGPDVFASYRREPELTAAALRDGRLHMGDLARIGDRGYIYIIDRNRRSL